MTQERALVWLICGPSLVEQVSAPSGGLERELGSAYEEARARVQVRNGEGWPGHKLPSQNPCLQSLTEKVL